MISQRKLDANRRNAAKSTGPRTAQGKAKVKLNAVTHGLTAATEVLPHEDEQAYQHRFEAWSRELNAPGDMGRYLLERMVKISWLLDEWTRILDWLGPLGPDGIASTEFDSRRDNIKRALQLVAVPFRAPEDPPVTTNDPLTAPFVRAWQALNDHVMIDAMGQEIEEEDDWPAALERQAELDKPYWAAVGVELLKLATERRARLKTMLARHQDNEDEARPRLAAEASFDDTAEGERVHRYQERWGRSLLRTLAKIEELRDRGQLDEEETEENFVGQDSHSVIPFIIEETRLESCPTGGRDVNDGPTGSVEAHPVEETERGQHRVAADEPAVRREEKRQNKPTAVTRTAVKMQPYVDRPVGSKATFESVHST